MHCEEKAENLLAEDDVRGLISLIAGNKTKARRDAVRRALWFSLFATDDQLDKIEAHLRRCGHK